MRYEPQRPGTQGVRGRCGVGTTRLSRTSRTRSTVASSRAISRDSGLYRVYGWGRVGACSIALVRRTQSSCSSWSERSTVSSSISWASASVGLEPTSHRLCVRLDGHPRQVHVAGDATVQQAQRLLQPVVERPQGRHPLAPVRQATLGGRVEHAVGSAQVGRAPGNRCVGAVLGVFQRCQGPLMRVGGGGCQLDGVRHVSGIHAAPDLCRRSAAGCHRACGAHDVAVCAFASHMSTTTVRRSSDGSRVGRGA